MSKWRGLRVSHLTPRVTAILVGAAVGIGAALALPYAQSGDADCPLFQARFETSEYPALEVHFCALVPSTGGAVVVRYDVTVHLAVIMPGRLR